MQAALDIERIAGSGRHSSGGVNRRAGPSSPCRREYMPEPMNAGDTFAAVFRCVKADEGRAARLCGFFNMRTVISVTTPSRPSGTGDDTKQIVAAGIEMLADRTAISPR